MARLRRETRLFKQRALNSLNLAIELFNRPHNVCRTEAVLIFLQHAFEMLLKGAIYEKRRTVHEPGSNITYRFDKCLAIARNDLGIQTDDMVTTLSMLDGFRDCATHHLLQMSEENLYMQAQAAVTVFNETLQKAFGESLADYFPARVLPISTNPPKEMLQLVGNDFNGIRDLLAPGKRYQMEARARIRPYLIMESVLRGKGEQPSNSEVSSVIKKVKQGQDWQAIFPGVATLRLDATGNGLTYSVRLTREITAPAVRILRDGEDAEGVALIREVNLLDRYSMGLSDLAEKAGLGRSITLALVHKLKLQEDPECFKLFSHKSLRFKGYSPKALEKIREVLPTLDQKSVWLEYRTSRLRAKKVHQG